MRAKKTKFLRIEERSIFLNLFKTQRRLKSLWSWGGKCYCITFFAWNLELFSKSVCLLVGDFLLSYKIRLGYTRPSVFEVRKDVHSQWTLRTYSLLTLLENSFHLRVFHNHSFLMYSVTSRFLHLAPLRRSNWVHESFKTLSVIATKNEADNRIDSTVPDSHIVHDIIIQPKATR